MIQRRQFLLRTAAGFGAVILPTLSLAQDLPTPIGATAVTQVFGDGLRFIAVALEFETPVDGSTLTAKEYAVEGRTVTEVYTATTADPSTRAESGQFVIVLLSPDDDTASLLEGSGQQGEGGSPLGGGQGGPSGPSGGPGHAGDIPNYSKNYLDPSAIVDQTDGTTTQTTATLNLIVDEFEQFEFTDADTGYVLPYNLFTPKDNDPAQAYPLVLFMHDAGVTNDVTRTTLFQGVGALVWAAPEEQAKRPSYVLAPQYPDIIADDASNTSDALDATIKLIEHLGETYNIDAGRRYTTGQSGGCMMSIAMNIKYPDFFAATYLVAGQWAPELVAPMAGNNIWILVSENDGKAYPGQIAITEALETAGATVSRAVWSARWTANQFQFAFDDIDAEGSAINFVTYADGTVFADGETNTGGGAGHTATWQTAYNIEPIREWLFRHSL